MSETNAPEPTMEEILASIRRIISEDDPPPAEAAAPVVEPAPAPAPPPPAAAAPPAPAPHPAVDEDVLELTEPLDPPVHHAVPVPKFEETLGDLDVFSTHDPAPSAPPPRTPPPLAPAFAEEPLVGSYASETSSSHFGSLARSVAMPKEGRSLEDVVRELLKPMLRDWLDTHLPAIVEARVQAEVERISRRSDY